MKRRFVVSALVLAMCLPTWLSACNSDDPASSGGAGGSAGSEETGGGESEGGEAGDTAGAGGSFVVPTEPKLEFTPIALDVGYVTDFDFIPGSNGELLVVGKAGDIHRLALDGDEATLIESSAITVFDAEGCGLLSLAFDPEFTDNGFVYLGRCVDAMTTTLSRYELGELADFEASEAEILTFETDVEPPEFWHRWGSLGFEPDGVTMWALLGDLFLRKSQDPTTGHGAVLRFQPNRESDGEGYEPAQGNAFDDEEEGHPAVYAYGFRSPFRAHRDRAGRFWVGDVGQYKWEEINLVGEPAQNFGWPVAEGECKEDCDGLTDPLIAYGRASDEPFVLEDPDTEPSTKRAVWVGVTYEGASRDRYYGLLDGLLLYGDFFTGWVRGVKVDDDGEIDVDRFLGHLTEVTSMRLGPDGYLYALTLGGTLYRLEQALD